MPVTRQMYCDRRVPIIRKTVNIFECIFKIRSFRPFLKRFSVHRKPVRIPVSRNTTKRTSRLEDRITRSIFRRIWFSNAHGRSARTVRGPPDATRLQRSTARSDTRTRTKSRRSDGREPVVVTYRDGQIFARRRVHPTPSHAAAVGRDASFRTRPRVRLPINTTVTPPSRYDASSTTAHENRSAPTADGRAGARTRSRLVRRTGIVRRVTNDFTPPPPSPPVRPWYYTRV